MENLITALGLINNYEVFIAICIGSFAGIIFGAIPGLTYSMAALMLLLLDTTSYRISLLLATYIGGMTGGSISAILIGIPGTPSAAATVSDGYSLSKKGDASIALGAAVIVSDRRSYQSIFNDSYGRFISKFAIKFGQAEIFMLCFWIFYNLWIS